MQKLFIVTTQQLRGSRLLAKLNVLYSRDANYFNHLDFSSCKMATFTPEGKTFLVTGGASGIGALYVEMFVKEGAKGVAIFDIQVDNGKKLVERLNKTYPDRVIFVKCDVGDEANVAEAFKHLLVQFKQLDVIINNAGIMVDSPTNWRKASDVNWQGLTDLTLKAIQHMRKDEGGMGGTIINISSIVAMVRYPFLPIYAGSKAAVLHFSQCISRGAFYDQTGVRILTVCLGPTDTPLLQGWEDRILDKTGLKQLSELQYVAQKPENVAAAVRNIFKKGTNGSVWLSIDNKPEKDITQYINAAYTELERVIFS